MSAWGLFWSVAGVLGIGGTIAAMFLFPAVLPIVLAFLRTRTGQIVAGILAVLAALAGARLKGRSEGKAAERKRQEQDDEDFLANKRIRDAGFDGLSDDELDQRLREGAVTKPPRG